MRVGMPRETRSSKIAISTSLEVQESVLVDSTIARSTARAKATSGIGRYREWEKQFGRFSR